MKKGSTLLLLATLTVGCVELPVTNHNVAKPVEPPKVTRAPAPVMPEQVNEANARSKAQALRDELDRAVVDESPATLPATSKTK